MTRFLKGTLDHDGDGKMGGSRKGSNMTKKKDDKPKGNANEKPDEAGSNDPASKAIFKQSDHREE